MTKTEVATVKPAQPLAEVETRVKAIIPQNLEEAVSLAQIIHDSGMAPKGMNTPQKIVGAILAGAELGIPPMQALQALADINGRWCVFGDFALGLCQRSGKLEDIEETSTGKSKEDYAAICRVKRLDRATETIRTFSYKDAVKARLQGKTGPWTDYPKRMMQMRARSFALRDAFPDVLKGLGIVEEVRDIIQPATAPAREPITAEALASQAALELPSEVVGVDGATDTGNNAVEAPEAVEDAILAESEDELVPAASNPLPKPTPQWLSDYERQLEHEATAGGLTETFEVYRKHVITARPEFKERADAAYKSAYDRIIEGEGK
jgi:hypothetical protein